MSAISENGPWKGASGRSYRLMGTDKGREGGMATIRSIVAVGPPAGTSTVPEGTQLALKLARATDPLAKESMVREVEIFAALCQAPGQAPCPRAYDTVGELGLVMEWCPSDLERWWADAWRQPRSFLLLCEAIADICRRVREYEVILEMDLGKKVIHADIKPRNVLRAADGRWLLTDFGASKVRPVEEEGWNATRMILGTENFIAPEALFNARKPFPSAMDTWSIGCTLFALLRMRAFLASGAALPINGTHSHHFRSHRVALVTDLQERRPTLFINKDLDASAFTSPDKLPDRDRSAVQDALGGVFGSTNPAVERMLANEVLRVLDRSLCIDPAKRYTDPLEMASDCEGLAERFRELDVRAAGKSNSNQGVAPPAPKPGPQGVPRVPQSRTLVPEDLDAPSAAVPAPSAAVPAPSGGPVAPAREEIPPLARVPVRPPPKVQPAQSENKKGTLSVPTWAVVLGVVLLLGALLVALVLAAGVAWYFLASR